MGNPRWSDFLALCLPFGIACGPGQVSAGEAEGSVGGDGMDESGTSDGGAAPPSVCEEFIPWKHACYPHYAMESTLDQAIADCEIGNSIYLDYYGAECLEAHEERLTCLSTVPCGESALCREVWEREQEICSAE